MKDKKIAVIDYRCGNLKSVLNGLKYVGADAYIEADASKLSDYDGFVLPGVGAFAEAIELLNQSELKEALRHEVFTEGKPLIGICLGMQLLCLSSEEGGLHSGLGWIDAEVKSFRNVSDFDASLKVPHMGWNTLIPEHDHELLTGLDSEPDVYFVHSYAVQCNQQSDVIASCQYGAPFVAAFARNNVMGVQFHPEKSHRVGLRMLENFVQLVANQKALPQTKVEQAVC